MKEQISAVVIARFKNMYGRGKVKSVTIDKESGRYLIKLRAPKMRKLWS